jgi:hypothetical protein
MLTYINLTADDHPCAFLDQVRPSVASGGYLCRESNAHTSFHAEQGTQNDLMRRVGLPLYTGTGC